MTAILSVVNISLSTSVRIYMVPDAFLILQAWNVYTEGLDLHNFL